MLTLAALLLWLSWLAGDSGFYDSVQCPAACLFRSQNGKGGEPKSWMIFNFFYVLYNYTGVLAPLLSRRIRIWWMDHVSLRVHPNEGMPPKRIPLVEEFRDWLRARKRELTQGESKDAAATRWKGIIDSTPIQQIINGAVYAVKSLALLLWLKETSESITFLELIAYFVLGVYWTVGQWSRGHSLMDDGGRGETTWGFGQLVPLFLLLIPFFQLFDSYSGHLEQKRRQTDQEAGKSNSSDQL